ncbi:hemicentin-1-like [Haliotis rufescens]|uniref:hemicentin-1-like n=1 Tax=Haliotis rufescens TaxID=6454 RepID=UPI00201EC0A9|nr:hemicentin-1-like [Haliotis rufescens]
MQTHVAALIVVIVNIGCTRVAVGEGPWCYDCDKAVKPASCGEIIKCKDDEQCYASSTGVSPTQYTAGCRKKQLCQGTGSVAGGSSPHGCEECCIGDHCNSKLCGGLPVPMGGSRLCLQCEAVRHPSQCSTVSKCGQDKYCSIWKRYKFQLTFYDLGCLEKTECDGHMKGEDELSYGGVICCNDDFCNSHENNNHLTPAPTETAATRSQPVTTIRTGNLLCKTCASIQQPSFCQSETQCGPDQYCSVRRVFRFGLTFYSLGCEEKTECEDHMTTLGEGGFRCCNEDRCNANFNPVTGTTTPTAITIPASPETSSVPTTTSSLPPSTTIRTGTLICQTCEIVQQPTFCQRETECGPEQYCSVRRVFKFGIIFYELGCEEKTACEDHMTTLGEAGFRCCNEDRCNANVNPKKPSSLTPMAPDIMNTNQSVNVIAGKTVLLLCNVTGNPEPSVTWTYDKQVSPNAHPKGSTLAISSVNEKNEGQYRCVANNALGTMEGTIHLHVIEPVFVKVEPPIVVISPGMSGVRLKCVGEGIPAPKATLSRLGGDITADRFYGHVNPAEILLVRITEANMLTYDGVYVCNATNGHTSASAYQIVAGNITRMLGENIAFNNISTTPLKAFHALCLPGQPQTDASPTTTEFDLGELICTSARKVGLIDTDAGSVTWLIRPDGKAQFLNGSMSVDLEQVNTSTTPASLVSSATTSSPLLAPDILNTNQTVNAILGETVLLFCNVSGNPTPSVTWEYDKSENPNAHPKGSTLAISSVNEKNKGMYRCVANNTQGTKEGIVNLHVIEPVSVKGEPPIVVISPGMRALRLKCVGEGIPPPSVTLSKYGEDITADKLYKHLGPAEILIMGITEASVMKYDGVYVCNATNGNTSASAYKIVPFVLLDTSSRTHLPSLLSLICKESGSSSYGCWYYHMADQLSPNAHPKGSTLAISSVNEKNEGTYRCVANNTLGTKEGVVNLHVIEPVSVKGKPPIVVISPGMRALRLKCVGEGIPPPSVTLSKYGEDITADKSYRYLGPAEILIMGITEANVLKYDGVYVCNATNGDTSASAYQIVASNVTRTLGENVTFNNVSTTPLKAFHALCPSGLTGPDGSPVTHEFNLDEAICTSARMVGLIDRNPGLYKILVITGKYKYACFLTIYFSIDFSSNDCSLIYADIITRKCRYLGFLKGNILI